MTKKVTIRRPVAVQASPEAWVAAGAEAEGRQATASEPQEPMKRLTIDLPMALHRRVKRGCADRDIKMADLVRDLLAREFPE
jgi:hypothetical protein